MNDTKPNDYIDDIYSPTKRKVDDRTPSIKFMDRAGFFVIASTPFLGIYLLYVLYKYKKFHKKHPYVYGTCVLVGLVYFIFMMFVFSFMRQGGGRF